jgi:hypothetical protein
MHSHLYRLVYRLAGGTFVALVVAAASLGVEVQGAGTVPVPKVTGPVAAVAVGDPSHD